jgi:GTP-binding protein
MFIDEAVIRVRGGRGGDGVIHFISNRHNPRGGPDGGNGGDGGDVILRASNSVSTLLVFRNRPRLHAGDGGNGGRGTCQGARGADKIVMVPVGTVARNLDSKEVLADLASPDDEFIVARGGEGGRGNRSFTTSVRRAPRICERGLRGEERTLGLELKLIADVGIIGYPNVGKSSLISRISSKKAKIADYPFTTVVPNLGVVDVDGRHQFVAVDIPGLIEGAHRGKGLGDRFLRHVERSRLLVHMVDLAAVEKRDPLSDYERINAELTAFSPTLDQRPQIVVGNKIDLLDEETIDERKARFARAGVSLLPVSVVTGRGIKELISRTFSHLQAISPKVEMPSSSRRRVYRYHGEKGFWIEREGEAYRVRGTDVERLVKKLNLDGCDAWAYLNERLDRMGVFRELSGEGVAEGDHIRIGDVELEFRK